jgi:hypothetical protein
VTFSLFITAFITSDGVSITVLLAFITRVGNTTWDGEVVVGSFWAWALLNSLNTFSKTIDGFCPSVGVAFRANVFWGVINTFVAFLAPDFSWLIAALVNGGTGVGEWAIGESVFFITASFSVFIITSLIVNTESGFTMDWFFTDVLGWINSAAA